VSEFERGSIVGTYERIDWPTRIALEDLEIAILGMRRVIQPNVLVEDEADTTTTTGPGPITVTIDGLGAVISTGYKGALPIPTACTITGWTVLSIDASPATSGSIVIDVWKDTYANFPPTVGDTITAAAKPTITTATKATGAPTGWTTAVAADDILAFNVDSCTSLIKVCLQLEVEAAE
jgi:hypothetical protein